MHVFVFILYIHNKYTHILCKQKLLFLDAINRLTALIYIYIYILYEYKYIHVNILKYILYVCVFIYLYIRNKYTQYTQIYNVNKTFILKVINRDKH